MIELPGEVVGLLSCAREEDVEEANECVTHLGLVLERNSVPGGGSGVDPRYNNISLSYEQREKLIREIGGLLNLGQVRVSAVWALGKGNSRSCLDCLISWIPKVLSDFEEMAVIQWMLAFETVMTSPADYKYPSELFEMLQMLSVSECPEVSGIAKRLKSKLSRSWL